MSQRPPASRPASRSPPDGQRITLPPVQLRDDPLRRFTSVFHFLEPTLQTLAARTARVHHCRFTALSSPCENINLLISQLSVETTFNQRANIGTSRNAMLSISNSLALSFDLVSTILGIVALAVTRRNHTTQNRGEQEQQNREPYAQHPQDVVVEEICLRRWRSRSASKWENGHAQLV
ncbi:hypothetical protein NA56DRAFT_706976 [Hyaloscypha hepaticicola]|uniref:Uncharacterized protein n=1 Tax=Hyaloscypha hepaticicola TaxID=2082293 RepID=A0A2J6PWE1_9HELO|nr:hypothetical protein NA56DRAFT_706976 [Hyaloscypha hepaticicola]